MKLILYYLFIIILFINTSNANLLEEDMTGKKISRIVFDSKNDLLPRNFRIIYNKKKYIGTKSIKASGSGQFSEYQLKNIKSKIPIGFDLIILDLRQESHGFINGDAISWFIEHNWINRYKTDSDIIIDEQNKLDYLKTFDYITISNRRNKDPINGKITSFDLNNINIENVNSEEEISTNNKVKYIRLYVTDHIKPNDYTVDLFIDIMKNLKDKDWLHIHCLAGKGRTTTFLAMYDMMKNAKFVDFETIIDRQEELGGINLAEKSNIEWKKDYKRERLEFIKNFYEYCKFNNDDYKTKWSTWNDYT